MGFVASTVTCGGSGGGAGTQFCASWAAGFCHRLFACTPADQRGQDFLGGSSEAQCTSLWNATCANPPPAGETFDVNCSRGAHVNVAARAACSDELDTISCDAFNSPDYVSVCTQVCAASAAGDGGAGHGGGGTAGGAGRAGGGPPVDSVSFCYATYDRLCELAFTCSTPAAQRDALFMAEYGANLTECRSQRASAQCAGAVCTPSYNAAAGASCVSILSAYTCDDVAINGAPASCTTACPELASPAGTAGTGGGAGAGGGARGGSGGTAGGAAARGPNLIANGDFADGATDWGVTPQAGSVGALTAQGGKLCMQLAAYSAATIGWPLDAATAVALAGGISYTLSFQASSSAPLASFQVKVGQAVPPYTGVDFSWFGDSPNAAPEAFTHAFTATADDPKAGLAFNASTGAAGATVCLANVALTAPAP